MSRHEPLVEFDSVLRDQAVEVAQIVAAVVDQPVDSDKLVLANPLASRPDEKPEPEGGWFRSHGLPGFVLRTRFAIPSMSTPSDPLVGNLSADTAGHGST
jgi:hypothetical protein